MGFLYESALEFSQIIMKPTYLIVLILMGFHLHNKNKNIKKGQRLFIKGEPERALEMTMSSIALGLVFGFIILVVFKSLVGDVDLSDELIIMFMVSILGSNLGSRFICFAYSGSVMCLLILILGSITSGIGVAQNLINKSMDIVILVGILHIVESILVFFDGGKGMVYYYRDNGKAICGGYKLSRRWIIPIVSFFTYAGYSSMSYSTPKKEKLKGSALKISIYGVGIIALAMFSRGVYLLEIMTVFIMFLGHEFVTGYKFNKIKKKEIFISDDGISVLDSLKHGKAKKAGINQGDKITHVNGVATNDISFLENVIDTSSDKLIDLKVKKYNGKIERYELELESIDELRIVLVPAKIPFSTEQVQKENLTFKEVLEKVEI